MGHPSLHQHHLSLSPSLVIICREQGQSSTLALLHLDLVPPPLLFFLLVRVLGSSKS